MLNTNFTEKFCKEGLTFDDVLLFRLHRRYFPIRWMYLPG